MRLLATVEVFDNHLRPVGVRKGPRSTWATIIDFVPKYGEGDALVVAKQGGERQPTFYTCSRLIPVENTDTSSMDKPLYLFPRAKREGFHGEYRVAENYLYLEPRRHSGMVRDLVHYMKLMGKGKPIDWKKLHMLHGVPIRTQDRKCECCVGVPA